MNIRDLIDEKRLQFTQDPTMGPSRPIVYHKTSDTSTHPYNSFVGVGLFNKTEKDAIGRFQSFGGLPLTFIPDVLDSIVYDSITWRVVRYSKMGTLYTVFCENKRHNGRPQ